MHAYTTLGMLALAGAALAAPAPHWGGPGGFGGDGGKHVVWETAIETIIVGPDGRPIGGPAPTAAPQGHSGPPPAPVQPTPAPVSPPQSYQVPEQPSATPEPQPEPQPQPSASPAPSSPPPSSGGGDGYMGVVNEWRQKLGLDSLTQDSTLEANALKTCDDGNGEMKHELNPGSFGQVLAPGQPSEFEHVFVGGWLCEKPDMPGMDGVCAEQSKGWAYDGTGHADILSSKDYTKIGCANAKGIWGCDVA